jgi:hypothetical protein
MGPAPGRCSTSVGPTPSPGAGSGDTTTIFTFDASKSSYNEVDYRLFDRMEFILHTGSAEFYHYIDLNRISDDYGGQIVTNITGGLGVFALKFQTKVTNIFLGPITMDSLMYGRYTKHLNFKNW